MNSKVNLLYYIVGRGSFTFDVQAYSDLSDAVMDLVSERFLTEKRGVYYPTILATALVEEALGL